ncbi:MAG TPA: hypothetical protein PK951_00655 [Chitinophagaceae bacterium]|nr:hypothetical protein [Chitinophagaceae bacterium]HUM64921.1 hypothetical protein [Chitinophagaceae bacterium]
MKAYKNKRISFLYRVFMVFSITWLTIGSSFIYLGQQPVKKAAEVIEMQEIPGDTNGNTCPFDDTEDSSEPISTLVEFLQEETRSLVHNDSPLQHNKYHRHGEFIFFHVKSFSPPPDQLS